MAVGAVRSADAEAGNARTKNASGGFERLKNSEPAYRRQASRPHYNRQPSRLTSRKPSARSASYRRPRKKKQPNNKYVLAAILVLVILIWAKWQSPAPEIPESQRRTAETSETVAGLHPAVIEKKNELVRETKKIGISIVITQGFRSHEEQDRLYEQGRKTEGRVVTNARGGESYHNYGLAIDFALRGKDGEVLWDLEYDGNGNGKSDWMEVVGIAKSIGFEWGGDWEDFPDYPHLQLSFGLSLADLQRGKRPPE